MKVWKNPEFWSVIFLIVATAIIVVEFYPHSPSPIILGSHAVYHWIGWTGALYIAIVTPVYHIIKRRHAKSYQTIMKFHILGNLIAFLLVSIHFTHQIGTPPILGTYTHLGLTMYTALFSQIVTGVLIRYQFGKNHIKTIRFMHVAFITTFYIVLLVHILHGLNVI
jgi:hypothetical protein